MDGQSVRFSKEDLQRAKVLNQVDTKFIACLIESSTASLGQGGDDACEASPIKHGGPTLILIDQHAADERVRVERYLREVCTGFLRHSDGQGVKTAQLNPPKPVLLTAHEVRRLQRSTETRDVFGKWGIHFGELPQEDRVGLNPAEVPVYVQVEVRAVPEVVADKVISDVVYHQ